MSFLRALVCIGSFAIFVSQSAASQTIDYQRLDERLTELADDDSIVGLAVAVIEGGEIRFAEGYGVARRGGGQRVTQDTVFRWASLSKGVASSLAGQVQADGLFSLADKIADMGSSLRLPGDGHLSATLEDVLSHRLGIVPNAYDTRLEDGRDPDDIRRALGALNRICGVGDCHGYQNVAFDAISEAIETATGTSYGEAAEARLFEPLGMSNASVGRDGLFAAPQWAQPHSRRRGERFQNPRTVRQAYYNVPAAGGVNGSIYDLALFARAQMGLEPDVLSQETLDDIHAPRVYTSREQSGLSRRYGGHIRDARYALGWRVYKYADRRVVGHRGAVEGYRSLILFDPEADTGVVALWNSGSRRPVRIQFEVMDMAYGLPQRDWLGLDAASARGASN